MSQTASESDGWEQASEHEATSLLQISSAVVTAVPPAPETTLQTASESDGWGDGDGEGDADGASDAHMPSPDHSDAKAEAEPDDNGTSALDIFAGAFGGARVERPRGPDRLKRALERLGLNGDADPEVKRQVPASEARLALKDARELRAKELADQSAPAPARLRPDEEQRIVPVADESDEMSDASLMNGIENLFYGDLDQPLKTNSSLGGDMPKSRVKQSLLSKAETVWQIYKHKHAELLDNISKACDPERTAESVAANRKCLLYIRNRSYDGTRSLARVPLPDVDNGWCDEELEAKVNIMANMFSWSAVLTETVPDDATTTLTIQSKALSLLQCLEGKSAEYIVAMLDKCEPSLPPASMFERIVDVVAVDEDNPNLRGERVFDKRWPNVAKLLIICHAHKIASVMNWTFDIVKEVITSIIQTALSERGTELSGLRRHLRAEITETIYITHTPPTESDIAFRDEMIATFCKDENTANKWKREMLPLVFTGRWSVCDCTEIYVPEGGDIIKATQAAIVVGPKLLINRKLRIVARSNFTGMTDGLEDLGLPEAVHGLFTRAYLRQHPLKKVAIQTGNYNAAVGDGERSLAIDNGPDDENGNESDGGEQADAFIPGSMTSLIINTMFFHAPWHG